MEHTGHYYEQLLISFTQAGLFATAVNPKLIKDFSTNSLRKVKTDKADSIKIARYALDRWDELIPYTEIDGLRSQLKQFNRQFVFYTKNKTAFKNNQISTRTTKRGSAELRRTLYMVDEVLLKTKPKDDPVYSF